MNRKAFSLISILLFCGTVVSFSAEVKMKISKRYLNFPISHAQDRRVMTMSMKGQEDCKVVIRLAEGNPDYWTFRDVADWKGKTLTITYEGSQEALEKIYQADTIAGDAPMYAEKYRPQYHFSTRRGWINDPNGLIYHKGTYHMFYQHNPYEREWQNMHWGHTVSKDLLHWEEQPLALHPDTIGTMFSGTAVIDYENTAGFNKKSGEPAMVLFYTADHPKYQRQCMAYSLDGGKTFKKYEGNPIIDSHEKWQSHDTRDPKVFWYAPGKHWVMVLNERDGHSIYNSANLKDWTYESHITGFWECPELFELPLDGNKNDTRWIMWGASGTYMIGKFDGKRFTPETPKLYNLNGSAYAAQIFANIRPKDGRVIKMAWGRISFDDMPFNGCMLLPQEQVLKTTPSGMRLISRPVKEVESLFTPVYKKQNLTTREANDELKKFDGNDMLWLRFTMKLTHANSAGLSYRGQKLVDYDMNSNKLNGHFYAPDLFGSMQITLDVYVDRGMVEVYADGGRFSYSMKRDVKSNSNEGYIFWGNNEVEVKSLEVFEAKSIWK